jgi:hypothetical protein
MRITFVLLLCSSFAATAIARKPRRFYCPPVAVPSAPRAAAAPELPQVAAQQVEVETARAAKVVVHLLEKQALAKWTVDDARAKELLRALIAQLDPHRLYFLAADWQEFAGHETSLDDQLKAGDLSFVKLVLQRFHLRAAAVQPLIQRALQENHDFTREEFWPFPYAGFARNQTELEERWRLRIKGELLFEKANETSLGDATKFLQQRYDTLALHQRSLSESYLQATYLDLLCKVCDRQQGYLGEDEFSHFRGKAYRGPKYTLNLRLWPWHQDRPKVWSVISHQVDPEELVGWDVVAIRTLGGPTHHLVGVGNYEPWPLQRAVNAIGDSAEVVLELQHPNTLQRKSLLWPQTEVKSGSTRIYIAPLQPVVQWS